MRLISLLDLSLGSGTQFYSNIATDEWPNHIDRLTAPISISPRLPDQFFGLPAAQSAQIQLSNIAIDSGTEGPTVSQITGAEELLGVQARCRLYDLDSDTTFLDFTGRVSEVTRLTQREASFTVSADDEALRQTLLPARRLLDVFPNAELNGQDEKLAVGVVFGTTRKATLVQVVENDYLTCSFTLTGAEPNKFLFMDLTNVGDYVVSAGDVLIYDVQWETANALVAIDLRSTDATELRTSGVDQNGLSANPTTDLSARTKNIPAWYRRKIDLSVFAGKTLNRFLLACENDSAGTHIGRIGRAVILHSNGSLGHTIIDTGFSPTTSTFATSNAGNSATIQNDAPASAWGALRKEATGTFTIENAYRDGTLIDPSEYSIVNALGAYKVLQFAASQRGANGELPTIQVDITSTEFSGNPATALKLLLENTSYGLGQTVNAASFTAAASQYTTDQILIGSGIFTQEPAGDILPQLLLHGARLALNTSGEWTLTVDAAALHTAGPIQLGQGDETGWDNFEPTDAAPIRVADRVKRLTLFGTLDPGLKNSGEAWLVRTTRTRAVPGVEREFRLRFVVDPNALDREAHYLWEQLTSQDRRLIGNIPITEPDIETLQLNDLLTVDIPNLLISAEIFLLRGLTTQTGAIELQLSGYSAAAYSYSAGTDQFIDPRALALTDTSLTLPDQPDNFTNSAPVTSVAANGVVQSKIQAKADAPPANVSSLIFTAISGIVATRAYVEVVVTPGETDVTADLMVDPGLTYTLECFAVNWQNDPGYQAGLVAQLTGISVPSDSDIPTNSPVPSGIGHTLNENGSMDVTLTWQTYSQGAVPADLLMVFSISGAGPLSPPVATNYAVHLSPDVTAYTFRGLNPATNYRFGIAAARRPATGGYAITSVESPDDTPDWADISFVGNYTGNINGTSAATVVVNAGQGATAFAGTVEWRSAGAPSNQPVPNVMVKSVNPDGSFDITAGWTYDNTTGARKASEFLFFWEVGTTPVTSSPHVSVPAVFNSTTTYTVRIEGIAQDTVLSLGVIASRTYEGNRQAGSMVTSTDSPDWDLVTVGTPDFTGTIAGTGASTVVAQAGQGATAFSGTVNYRSGGGPTNNPDPDGLLIVPNTSGIGVDYTLIFDYTQGAKPAKGFFVFVAQGDVTPVITDPHFTLSAKQSGTFSVSIALQGYPIDDVLSFGVAAYCDGDNGLEINAIITSNGGGGEPDWQGISTGSPSYAGPIFGVEQHNFEARSTGASADESPNIGMTKDGATLTWAAADFRYGGSGNITLAGGFNVLIFHLVNKVVEYAHNFCTRALSAETYDANLDRLITDHVGSPTIAQAVSTGKFGRGFEMNAGSATRAQIRTPGASTRFNCRSYECWVKTDGGTGPLAVISSTSDQSSGVQRRCLAINTDGTLLVQGSDDAGNFIALFSTTVVNDNAWHHVAAHITSAGAFCLYVDGIREDINTPAGGMSKWIGNSGGTYYLCLFHFQGANFSGDVLIDELAYAATTWQANSSSDFTPLSREYEDTWQNINPTTSGLWHFQERAGTGWYSALRPAKCLYELITKYEVRAAADGQSTSNFLIILMSGFDTQSGRLTDSLPDAVKLIGGSQSIWRSSAWQSQAAYVLVGQTLLGEGNGLERYAGRTSADAKAYAFVAFQTQDDRIVAQTGQGWQPTLTPGAPTNNPSPSTVGTTGRPSGSTVITIGWTYSQPSFSGDNKPADFLEVGVLTGDTSNFDVAGVQAFKVAVTKTSFNWDSAYQQTWSFAVRSGRYSASGEEVGPWQTSAGGPDWQGIGGTTQISKDPGISGWPWVTGDYGDGTIIGTKIAGATIEGSNISDSTIANSHLIGVSADKITTGILNVDPVSGGATAIYIQDSGKLRIEMLAASPATIAFENTSQVEQARITGTTAPSLRIEPASTNTGNLSLGHSSLTWDNITLRANSDITALCVSGGITLNGSEVVILGDWWTDAVEASAPPGSANQRIPIRNQAGSLLGYIAVHPTS